MERFDKYKYMDRETIAEQSADNYLWGVMLLSVSALIILVFLVSSINDDFLIGECQAHPEKIVELKETNEKYSVTLSDGIYEVNKDVNENTFMSCKIAYDEFYQTKEIEAGKVGVQR